MHIPMMRWALIRPGQLEQPDELARRGDHIFGSLFIIDPEHHGKEPGINRTLDGTDKP